MAAVLIFTLALLLSQSPTVTRVGTKVGMDVNCVNGCSGGGGGSSGLVYVADAGVLNINPVAIASAPTLNIGDAGVLNVNFPASQTVNGSVSVSNFPATQPVSGSVAVVSAPTINIADAGTLNVNPITVASLPLVFIQDAGVLNVNLPPGAATSAKQDTGNTSLANLDVALSTRTKPADQQHVIIDTVTPAVTVAQSTAANLNATITGTVTTTPPANASTNVAQFGGSNVATGTGAAGVGVPRVTISSDSSLAANQSTNVAQINGVQTQTGAGSSGTGTIRVMLASDSALAANQSVNGASESATGSAPPAKATFMGYRESTNLVGAVQCDKTAKADIATATTTALVAVSGSTTIYVCSYVVEIQGVVTTAGTLVLERGTGAACVTSPTAITPTYTGSTTAGNPTLITHSAGNGYLFKTAGSDGLCALSTTTTPQRVFIAYAQF